MESNNDSNSSKPRYDITMSKRTRRNPSNLINTVLKPENESPTKEDRDSVIDQEGGVDRKSLEHLINSRNSLGKHFTEEENQLQIVKKNYHQDEDKKGFKLKGIFGHYTKVLSHLLKVKRDPSCIVSKKKPILRLSM